MGLDYTIPNEGLLRKIFEEEREKLSLSFIDLVFLAPIPDGYIEGTKHWRIVFHDYKTSVGRNEDDSLLVQFHPKAYKTPKRFRSRARHELYHIYRNHETERKGLRYWLKFEPAATLYQYLDIRVRV